MRLNYLIYYIISLVNEGHKWQYQNLTNSGKKPLLWFTGLQFVALFVSVAFVITQPEGILKENVIDYILSSLSIMTGIYLSLLVFVYDRYKLIDFKQMKDDNHKWIRTWCFYSQLNGLISYSILVAIIVILILIATLLFGQKIDLTSYVFTSDITINSAVLLLRLSFVVCMRIAMVYFLIDFFILCIYIVSGIFHFIKKDMDADNPQMSITNTKTACSMLMSEHKWSYIFTIVGLVIITLLASAYILYNFIHP